MIRALTKSQRIMLEKLKSMTTPYEPNESNFGERTRVLKNLVSQGFASEYVHGGYEITDAGRIALRS